MRKDPKIDENFEEKTPPKKEIGEVTKSLDLAIFIVACFAVILLIFYYGNLI